MNPLRGYRMAAVASTLLLAVTACSGAVATPLPRENWPTTAPLPLPAHPQVVAIGDSIMKGHGLDPVDAWPARLAVQRGWKLQNLSCDGAGFLATGDESDCAVDFGGLVSKAIALTPTIVIVSGSSNDFGEGNAPLLATTLASIARLRAALPHARIIGLSTVWSDTVAPAQIAQVDAQVKRAVTRVGGVYIDIGQPLFRNPDWMQSDHVHPNAEGQIAIQAAVDVALTKAHLTE